MRKLCLFSCCVLDCRILGKTGTLGFPAKWAQNTNHPTPKAHHCQHASVVVSLSSVHKRRLGLCHLRIAVLRPVITPGRRTRDLLAIWAPSDRSTMRWSSTSSPSIPCHFTLPNVQKRRRRRSFMTRVGNIQSNPSHSNPRSIVILSLLPDHVPFHSNSYGWPSKPVGQLAGRSVLKRCSQSVKRQLPLKFIALAAIKSIFFGARLHVTKINPLWFDFLIGCRGNWNA